MHHDDEGCTLDLNGSLTLMIDLQNGSVNFPLLDNMMAQLNVPLFSTDLSSPNPAVFCWTRSKVQHLLTRTLSNYLPSTGR
jgi:hypothetical protein